MKMWFHFFYDSIVMTDSVGTSICADGVCSSIWLFLYEDYVALILFVDFVRKPIIQQLS